MKGGGISSSQYFVAVSLKDDRTMERWARWRAKYGSCA